MEALDRALIHPTSILLGIMFFATLSGIDAINAYTTHIFESAGSTIDPKLATIIIGIVTMVSAFPAFKEINTQVVDGKFNNVA